MKPGPKPLLYKVCPVCGIEKPRDQFYKKLDTISHKCKPCSLADAKKRAGQYIGKYIDKQNEWRRQKYATSETYRQKIANQKQALYVANRERILAARRARWANDPSCPDRLFYRYGYLKQCTPPWADKEELRSIYGNCPKGMHVDHIIPIRGLIDGRPVCGLNVPWNLQYLPARDNLRKKNRVSEQDISVVKR